jgi:peptidyl-prolyl cis-trans isomerase B (cyclophilin B)
MKKFIRLAGILMLIASLMMVMAGCGGSSSEEQAESQEPETEAETAPAAEPAAEPIGIHHAEIEIADYGTIKLELDGDTAPITVQNFMDLANAGFYDGLTFHRIMDGFMIQGGDPNGDGTGGSDKNIKGEFAMNGVENNISHVKGVILMARAQDPDSGSSQFFITVDDATFLDGQYAAFGHVTEGQEVADKIAADAEPLDDNGTVAPEAQPVITAVRIID